MTNPSAITGEPEKPLKDFRRSSKGLKLVLQSFIGGSIDLTYSRFILSAIMLSGEEKPQIDVKVFSDKLPFPT